MWWALHLWEELQGSFVDCASGLGIHWLMSKLTIVGSFQMFSTQLGENFQSHYHLWSFSFWSVPSKSSQFHNISQTFHRNKDPPGCALLKWNSLKSLYVWKSWLTYNGRCHGFQPWLTIWASEPESWSRWWKSKCWPKVKCVHTRTEPSILNGCYRL